MLFKIIINSMSNFWTSAKSETTDKIFFWLIKLTLTDEIDTDWRDWHWLTKLTLAEKNNFWLRKLILLIEKFFYEVINLSFNLLFISTLLCYSFCNHRKQRRRKQRRRKQRRRKQHRRKQYRRKQRWCKQHRRNIVVNNVIATSS